MNTSIILLIVGVFLAVGVIVYLLTRHKKSTTVKSLISSDECSGPNFTGKTWKNILSGSDVQLLSVSFSKDEPLKILAKNNYGDTLVYSSIDGGKNWNKLGYDKFNNKNPVRVRVFKNFQLAFDNMNNVYLSTDMFETIDKTYDLKPQLPTNNWLTSWDYNICGSDDGSVIFIPVYPQSPRNVTGFVRIMFDTSLNLTVKYTQLTDQYNTSMCCSSDAKYVCYISFKNNDIFAYLSNDAGITWTQTKLFNTLPQMLTSVNSTISDNGSVIVISGTLSVTNNIAYFVSYSIDSGKTWSNRQSNSQNFYELSPNGWNQLSLTKYSNNDLSILCSRDLGNTFFNITTSDIINKTSQDTVVGQKDKNITIPTLVSIDGNYSLKSQSDANLVVYDKTGKAYWNSYGTNQTNFPQCDPVNSCVYTTDLQVDGNLATYSNKPNKNNTNNTWSATGYPNTNFKKRDDSSAPYTLKLYNSGQLGIYDSNGNIIWSTGSVPSIIPASTSFGNLIMSNDYKTIIAVINGNLYSLM